MVGVVDWERRAGGKVTDMRVRISSNESEYTHYFSNLTATLCFSPLLLTTSKHVDR